VPRIPIIPRNIDESGKALGQCRGSHALTRPLPIFYMSDYSVLGLLVDKLEETFRLIEEGGFSVTDEAGDLEVTIDHCEVLEQIVRLLRENGIQCEFADVVSGIYQG
jgi:hypothetical protein